MKVCCLWGRPELAQGSTVSFAADGIIDQHNINCRREKSATMLQVAAGNDETDLFALECRNFKNSLSNARVIEIIELSLTLPIRHVNQERSVQLSVVV